MARPESAIVADDPMVAEFAQGLRDLRRSKGLTYQALADAAFCATGTLCQAAKGRALPSLVVTLAYVRGCSGDEDAWRDRWQAVHRHLNPGVYELSAPMRRRSPDAVGRVVARRPPPHRRDTRVREAIAALLVVVVMLVTGGVLLGRVLTAATTRGGPITVADTITPNLVPSTGLPDGPSGEPVWLEIANSRHGVAVFDDPAGDRSSLPFIPFGMSVQVLCSVPAGSGTASTSPLYLIAGPSPWIGSYAPAKAFNSAGGPTPGSAGDIAGAIPSCGSASPNGGSPTPATTRSPTG